MDCTTLKYVQNPNTGKWMRVPCGMCIGCRIAKTREWSLRLLMESKSWKKCCFLTLTYDEEHLPHTGCGRMTLDPEHTRKFWNRERMHLHRWKLKNDADYRMDYVGHSESPDLVSSPPLLKYFMCGEYGDSYKRPHYHAIVFGTDFTTLGNWWIHHYQDGKPVYTSDELIKMWPYGMATVDDVTIERIRYVVGYVQKKIYKDPWKYFQEYGCCVHPFQRQSNGLCLNYYTDHKDDYWINLHPRVNGVSYSTPRYLLKKDSNLKLAMSLIHDRLESQGAFANTESYESMKQREIDMKAKSRLKKGNL